MDNFPSGHSQDANAEHGAKLRIAEPFETMHADDNFGDEAPFHSTWQVLASGDAPND